MRIAISGAAGRMGKRIMALAYENPEIDITGALEAPGHPAIGKDAGEIAGIGRIDLPVTDDRDSVVEGCDALIDFSSPKASLENVKVAARQGKAIVIGTTGFSEEQRAELSSIAPNTRTLIAPNMSMGVNLLFSIVGMVTKALGETYDIEIVEAHHRLKKDAPSGTAKKLAEIAASALGRNPADVEVTGRSGIVGERTRKEIGVMALRGGDVVGEHTVMFITEGERVELTHKAHSRDAFAKGALEAAFWLVGRPNGLYDMQDVLGLKNLT
jgi:4-hydroxy-tetrahydrodipicolinate reductase